MARRRTRTPVLDNSTGEPSQMLAPTGSIMPVNTGDNLTRDEERTLEEFRKQWLVLQGQKAKTAYAVSAIGDLNEFGTRTFVDTADAIEDMKAGEREVEHQAYIDEFCNRAKKATANHILAVTELGARHLAEEVTRPLYLLPEPPPPPKKRSVREWLFG